MTIPDEMAVEMTKREYFAAIAMQAMAQGVFPKSASDTKAMMAGAVGWADKLIAALNVGQTATKRLPPTPDVS